MGDSINTVVDFLYGRCSIFQRERPARLYFCGGYGLPVTKYKDVGIGNSLFDKIREGGGGGFSMTIPVFKKYHLGLGVRNMNYQFHKHLLASEFNNRYQTPGYVTDTSVQDVPQTISFVTLGLEFSRVYSLRFIEIEPYIRCGVAGVSFGYGDRAKVRQYNLEKRDVEFINVKPDSIGSKPAMFGCAGVRLNRWILKKSLNVSVAAQYLTTSNNQLDFIAERVDFYNNKQFVENFSLKERFTTFQMEFSVQMRIWRNRSRDRKKEHD